MTTKTLTFLLIICTLLSCKSKSNSDSRNELEIKTKVVNAEKSMDSLALDKCFIIDNDSVTILPFEIEISLSSKAQEKIVKSNETIIIDVSLTGEPKPSTPSDFISEDGLFYVASARKEINYGQIAEFDKIKFSRLVYNELLDKDVDVTVNVFSGRKSSENNLLDSELLYEKISKIVNKRFILKSKLIYGDD